MRGKKIKTKIEKETVGEIQGNAGRDRRVSSRMECHQGWSVIKGGVSSRMECHQGWSVIKDGVLDRRRDSVRQ